MLGNYFFHAFFVTCTFCFNKIFFSKISLLDIIRVLNSLDPDQARHNVGPDQCPYCMQMISANDNPPPVGKELSLISYRWHITKL